MSKIDNDPFETIQGSIQALVNELRQANAEKEILRAALREIAELTPAYGTIHKTAVWALESALNLRRSYESNLSEVNPAVLFGKPVLYVECLRNVPDGTVP